GKGCNYTGDSVPPGAWPSCPFHRGLCPALASVPAHQVHHCGGSGRVRVRRLELNRWRGQFDRPEVIRTIRRKIRGTIASERTVLVDLEGAGITQEQAAEIMVGWSDREVKFCG